MGNTTGLIIVSLAGILQGSFILPMTYTRRWDWAHKWFSFSVLGMFLLNWIIAFSLIQGLPSILVQIPKNLLAIVLLFGLGWGAGAILFGKGMDLLGMALGYPVIMGINAAAGTVIPALIFSPEIFLHTKGIFIMTGAMLTVFGIIACAKASTTKMPVEHPANRKNLGKGLVIAVIAGFTSCLPNLGAAFSGKITSIALESGVSQVLAGNVVWSLFFTAGAIVNAGYCLFLTEKEKTTGKLITEYPVTNWLLLFSMSLMWIGSFYFYGIGCSMADSFGLIIGWPLLISLSIIVGNFWGLFRGEWKGASPKSKRILNFGLFLLVLSVIIIAASNGLN